MIERAIEDWLTKASERDFQIPFSQVLFSRGHKILYVSQHRPLEQGKDLITLDEQGGCCAYQLKAGDIDIPVWRRIRGEIVELVELPPVHPSLVASVSHTAFLVTNGNVTDEVRYQIDLMNRTNVDRGRHVAPLRVLARGDLVRDFVDCQSDILPSGLDDMRQLLELFLHDGREFLPLQKLCHLLTNVALREGTVGDGVRASIRAIASSVILASFVTSSFQSSQNHYALFEAWIALLASLVHYGSVRSVPETDWESTYSIVFSQAVGELRALRDEALTREDLLEGRLMGDGGPIYAARSTLVLGAVAALECYLCAAEPHEAKPSESLALLDRYRQYLWLWGEAAVPFLVCVVQFLEMRGRGENALQLLTTLLGGLIEHNAPASKRGLPSPYYDSHSVINHLVDSQSDDLDDWCFSGRSYSLESIVLMLVRRGMKDFLASSWTDISRVLYAEFVPSNDLDLLQWRVRQGANRVTAPGTPESWHRLQERASALGSQLPGTLVSHRWLLHFLVLAYPHRFTPIVSSFLDGHNDQGG